MKKLIGWLGLKILGWRVAVDVDSGLDRCVLVVAPHTSNLDFPITLFTLWCVGLPWKFFIKNNYTKPPIIGSFFHWLGAIGVERNPKKKKINLVQYAVNLFEERDRLILLIPAEGTRSRVDKWKTGFYHIAKKANVPVALGYGDYKTRTAGIGKIIHLSENFEKDMKEIQKFYKDKHGRYTEKFNPNIYMF